MNKCIKKLNIIISFSIIIFMQINDIYAQNEEKITKKDAQIVKEKLEQLSKRLENIERKKISKDEYQQIKEKVDLISDDINEFSEILEVVERKSLVDIIEASADLRVRFDRYDFYGHDYDLNTGVKKDPKLKEVVRILPSNRFRLKLKANLSKNLKFNSRLIMYKNWADDDEPVYPEVNFFNQSRIPTNVNMKVERAYVDYFYEISDKLQMAFTFGRHPTTDGLPTDLRENTPRKSNYPGLAYDLETDAIAVALLLDKITKMPNTAFKIGASRRVDDNEASILGQPLSDKTGIYRVDENAMDEVNMFLIQFETGFNRPLLDSILIFNLFIVPDIPTSDLRYNSDLSAFFDPDSPLYVEKPDNIGHLVKYTLFFETKGFLNSNFDWFFGASYLKSKAKGALKFMFDPQKASLPGEPILARHAYAQYKTAIENMPTLDPLLKSLQNAPNPIGLINDDGISDREGYAFHLGFRYNIPLTNLYKPKIGFEYNYGSKYWFGANDGAEDPLRKLDIRGHVYDSYLIIPFNRFFMLRTGYTRAYYNYNNGFAYYHGQPLDIDHDVYNTYFIMDAKF